MCLRVYILLVLAQAGRSSFTFGCLRTVFTSGMASGKPRCPCGNAFLSELSPNMLITWAGFEGERWFRLSNRQAYFLFCKSCHEARWPQDSRSQRHCRPNASAWRAWQSIRDGRVRLLAGDFFLTRACPEFETPRPQLPAQPPEPAPPPQKRSRPSVPSLVDAEMENWRLRLEAGRLQPQAPEQPPQSVGPRHGSAYGSFPRRHKGGRARRGHKRRVLGSCGGPMTPGRPQSQPQPQQPRQPQPLPRPRPQAWVQ